MSTKVKVENCHTQPEADSRLDDWFIQTYLIKDGETLAEAKKRLYTQMGIAQHETPGGTQC